MPPRRCARRRGARCSPAATRRATAWSGWPITAGSTAPASARSRASVRIGLAYSAFRYAARDVVSVAARLRRVRRVQLLLRVRRRARRRVARRPAGRAVPADRGLLRNPPAVSARPLRTRRRRTGDAARLPARHRRRAGRTSPTSTARSPSPTPRSGELLDTLDETGLAENTWVVFMTDHGPALPRAKSTLYDAGTGIALIVRPPRAPRDRAAGLRRPVQRRGPAAHAAGTARGAGARRRRRTIARAKFAGITPSEVRFAPRSTRRRPTTILSIRSERSGPRNTATSRTTRRGRCSTCRGTSRRVHPGRRWRHCVDAPRPERELYDLVADPTEREQPARSPPMTDKAEAIANDLALLAQRLAAEDQRRHSVGLRRHPHIASATRRPMRTSTASRYPAGRPMAIGTRHRRPNTSQ